MLIHCVLLFLCCYLLFYSPQEKVEHLNSSVGLGEMFGCSGIQSLEALEHTLAHTGPLVNSEHYRNAVQLFSAPRARGGKARLSIRTPGAVGVTWAAEMAVGLVGESTEIIQHNMLDSNRNVCFLFFSSELYSLEVLAVCWSCVYNVNFPFFFFFANVKFEWWTWESKTKSQQQPNTMAVEKTRSFGKHDNILYYRKSSNNTSCLWLDRTQVPGNSYTFFSVFMVHYSVLIFFKWAFRHPWDILKRQLGCMKLRIVLLWRVFLPYLLSDSTFWQETEALIPLCSLQCHQTPLTKTVI